MEEKRNSHRRKDEEIEIPKIDEILAWEGISKLDAEKYEQYSVFYRALQAVTKHQKPSPATVERFENLEAMIRGHIDDEMKWKNDVLSAISGLTLSVNDMKPTVKKVSDLDTFIAVGNRVGWIFLAMGLAAVIGLYHFGREIWDFLKR